MQAGMSLKTNGLLRLMGKEHLSNLEDYISASLQESYLEISSKEDIYNTFNNIINTFISSLSDDERIILRLYTGYDFRGINSLLRGIWDYDLNGKLTEEVINKYKDLCNDLELIINRFPKPNINFKVYRGVDIKPFYEYGIYTIEELINMKDKYYYESGFTSTSLLRDTSFYYNKSEWSNNSNIEIEYYIPKESEDGALLLTDDLSYSKDQNEYLINSGSLFKIIDVKIEDNKAYLKAILIPKKIWNIVLETKLKR